jgi:protein-disulfide isomerase
MKSGKVFVALALGLGALLFGALALHYRSSGPAGGAAGSADAQLLVRPHSPVLGPATAPVTLVEFLDPECEACRAMHPIVEAVLAEYAGRVRLVIRYLPLHANSLLAASALEEARELGKYEQALDVLFENQPTWGSHHDPKPELIPGYLESIGIPASGWELGAIVAKQRGKIEQDAADGKRLGVRGTPTFFVNGVELPELGYEPLKRAIERALAGSPAR